MARTSTTLAAVLLLTLGGSFPAHADVPEAATACLSCHGVDGQQGVGGAPAIGGQKVEYLLRQLAAYRSGLRQNPIMNGLTRSLSQEDLVEAAEYYASQDWRPRVPASRIDRQAAERGHGIAGNCIACHGVAGITVNAEWPNLAGLDPEYLVQQLMLFREGTRQHKLMNGVARRLDDGQMRAVANYYASLGD